MTNAGEDAMSRLDAQIRNCSRKKPLTEEQAITIVIQQGYPVSPYGCLQCGHWHVGTDIRCPKRHEDVAPNVDRTIHLANEFFLGGLVYQSFRVYPQDVEVIIITSTSWGYTLNDWYTNPPRKNSLARWIVRSTFGATSSWRLGHLISVPTCQWPHWRHPYGDTG